MFKKAMLAIVFISFVLGGAFAQTSPGKAIRDLKKGVLIVRLPGEYNKIEKMQRLNMTEKAQKVIAKRDEENKLWLEAFTKNYTFSEVLFAYDSLRKSTLDAGCKNCFLNADLEIDTNLTLGDRPFLMLFHGNANAETGSGAEGLIFKDPNFKALERPFPYFFKTVTFGYLINKIIKKDSWAESQNIKRLVLRLEERLTEFYDLRD